MSNVGHIGLYCTVIFMEVIKHSIVYYVKFKKLLINMCRIREEDSIPALWGIAYLNLDADRE